MTSNSKERKETPVVTGVLDYFPLAIAAVARVSHKGNAKHNPGEPLHWSRDKSTDHADCIGRHLAERDQIAPDSGELHAAHIAWRALAYLQLAEEKRSADCVRSGLLQTNFHPVPDTDPLTNETLDRRDDPNYNAFLRVRASCPHVHKKKVRVYCAGPMRGIKDFNFPAFDAARDRLKARDYEVISPADIDREKGFTDDKGYAQRDVAAILTCNKLYLLRGWTKSVGAAAEFFLARWIGLEIECENNSADPLWDYCSDNIISRTFVPKREAE